MDADIFLAGLRECLAEITTPRYFANEHGYQGELLAQLRMRMGPLAIPAEAIVEQEHQKVFANHFGLTNRPDIIIHEPYDPERHAGYHEGNHVVIELKRRASAKRAQEDFGKIGMMFAALNYPLGIFINVDAGRTFAADVPQELRGRVVCFAVSRVKDGAIHIVEDRT